MEYKFVKFVTLGFAAFTKAERRLKESVGKTSRPIDYTNLK